MPIKDFVVIGFNMHTYIYARRRKNKKDQRLAIEWKWPQYNVWFNVRRCSQMPRIFYLYFTSFASFNFSIFWIILILDFTISHLLEFWTFRFLNNSFIGFYYFISFGFLYFPFWVSFSGLKTKRVELKTLLVGPL